MMTAFSYAPWSTTTVRSLQRSSHSVKASSSHGIQLSISSDFLRRTRANRTTDALRSPKWKRYLRLRRARSHGGSAKRPNIAGAGSPSRTGSDFGRNMWVLISKRHLRAYCMWVTAASFAMPLLSTDISSMILSSNQNTKSFTLMSLVSIIRYTSTCILNFH